MLCPDHLGSSLLDKPEFFDIFLIQGRCSTPDLVSLVFPQPAATGLANVARYVVSHHLHKGAFLTHVQLSVYQGASRPFLQSCPAVPHWWDNAEVPPLSLLTVTRIRKLLTSTKPLQS